LHVSVQALFTQAGWPLGSVAQTCPHPPQFVAVLVVSTQPPLHTVCDALEQPDMHVNVSADPDATQTGVLPVQALPQPPQSVAVSKVTHLPLQRL
jgi:hypothetical protein